MFPCPKETSSRHIPRAPAARDTVFSSSVSLSSLLELVVVLVLLLVLAAHVPGLDDPALGGVDVLLVLDVLDADAQAVLCEDDVLLAHLLGDVAPHADDAEVDLVADEGQAADDDEGDDEREELAVRHIGGVSSGFCNAM